MKDKFICVAYRLVILAIIIGVLSKYYFVASVISGIGTLFGLAAIFLRQDSMQASLAINEIGNQHE